MLIDVELPGLSAQVLVVEEDGALYVSQVKKAMLSIDHRDFDMTDEVLARPDIMAMIDAHAVKLAEQQRGVA